MSKIFEKAKDKNIAKTIIYVDDSVAYYDEACTQPVQYAEDAIDLFINGVIMPVYYNEAIESYALIDSVGVDGKFYVNASAVTAELPSRPEPELPEDVHTIPENKWNDAE